MATSNFQQKIFQELKLYFEPLNRLYTTDEVLSFFDSIGWDISTICNGNASSFVNNVLAVKNSLTHLDHEPSTFVELIGAINDAKTLFNAIKGLPDSFPSSVNISIRNQLIEDLFEKLTLAYLGKKSTLNYRLLQTIGVIYKSPSVIYETNSSNTVIRRIGETDRLSFNNLFQFISSSKSRFNDEYWPGGESDFGTLDSTNVVAKKLFYRISNLLSVFGLSSWVSKGSGPDFYSTNDSKRLDGLITIGQTIILNDGTTAEFGTSLGLLPTSEGGPGAFIVPFGELNVSKQFGSVYFFLRVNAGVTGLKWKADGIELLPGSTSNGLNALMGIAPVNSTGMPVYQIGSTSGTHLQIGNYIIKGYFNADAQKQDAGIEMELRDSYLKIAGKDGDGFISKVIPEDGLKVNFNLTVGYSKNNGLYLGGSGGVQTSIPVNKSLGPVDFKTVDIGIGVINGEMKATVGASLAINLGLFTAELKDVGIKADIGFPSGGGNLGPIDLDMGFKLPKGVGIAFQSDLVTGGGYIEYDEVKGEYGGVVEIKILNKITAKAVAVLSTKMADGSKGFSLLLIVSAEGFTPVPLGFGFNLVGVGGLLGLNRGYVRDELVKGLNDGGIKDVMFPQIIEKDPKTGENKVNFSRVISNVTRFFPAEEDRFLFGPFGKINWGGGTLINADVGIVFKIPEFAVLMLGVIRVRVPDESKAYLKLNINFLGEINLKKKYVAFDAVIYNSQLLTFTLSGTMAFRFLWGDHPQFLMSIGGFHPAYQVPSGLFLPAQQRLAVSIADSDNLKIRLQSYFALTSNSVQFGAALYGYAEMGPCSAEGAVIFDALFMFSPFRMDIAIAIYVRLKYHGDTILSANLEMNLTGPDPWRAKGSISFTVFGFIDCSIDIDHKFGNGTIQALPPVNIWSKLLPALSLKDNWKTTIDLLESQQVTMRKVDTSNLLVAPNGKLVFQQGIVPLFTAVQKFGQNPIDGYSKFDLINVRAGSSVLSTSIVRDNFPSGEFFRLSDSQKLDSANSYTSYPNGLELAGNKIIFAPYYNRKEIQYEETFIDGAQVTRNKFVSGALPASLASADLQFHLQESSIIQNGFSANKIPVPVSMTTRIEPKSGGIKIIDKTTGASIAVFATPTEAGSELASIVKNDPSLRGKYTISY